MIEVNGRQAEPPRRHRGRGRSGVSQPSPAVVPRVHVSQARGVPLSAANGCTCTMAAAGAVGSIRAARDREDIMEKDGRISHIAAWLVSVA